MSTRAKRSAYVDGKRYVEGVNEIVVNYVEPVCKLTLATNRGAGSRVYTMPIDYSWADFINDKTINPRNANYGYLQWNSVTNELTFTYKEEMIWNDVKVTDANDNAISAEDQDKKVKGYVPDNIIYAK